MKGLLARGLLGASADTNTLYFFYDLKKSPLSFDFLWNLCLADCERQRRDLSSIHVVFVSAGSWRDGTEESEAYLSVIDAEARRWRFENIMLPGCHLVPAVSGYSFYSGRAAAETLARLAGRFRFPENYTVDQPLPFRPVVPMLKAAAKGISPQAIRATKQGLRFVGQWLDENAGGKKAIVITLRQYNFGKARNSDLDAWGRFARKLIADGYFPVIVPDTEKAMQPPPELEGLPFFSEAAWHLGLRAALYELAWLNLGSAGGPIGTLGLLDPNARVLIFKQIVEEERLTSEQRARDLGLPVDGQFPFCNSFQRVLWRTPDDFDSLVREFDQMADEIGAFEQSEVVSG